MVITLRIFYESNDARRSYQQLYCGRKGDKDMLIQWYPGHMVKAKRLVQENLKLVDVVIELVDARIPLSSRNPALLEIIQNKPRVIALNKSDLAEPNATSTWIQAFRQEGVEAMAIESIGGKGIHGLIQATRNAASEKMAAIVAKGRRERAVRAMILGIPNVGKSSLINRLAGTGNVKTGDRPGVTKGKQWIRIGKDFELLDTPGILWPKFEDQEVGFKLAVTGAISDEVVDIEKITLQLLDLLKNSYHQELKERYKLETLSDDTEELLQMIGKKRGFLQSGGTVDLEKSARTLLWEFRNGKIGRVTLDIPQNPG
jgi:ribosome biogenesis GTPase A